MAGLEGWEEERGGQRTESGGEATDSGPATSAAAAEFLFLALFLTADLVFSSALGRGARGDWRLGCIRGTREKGSTYGVLNLNEAFEASSPSTAAALGMKRAGSWGQLKTRVAEIVCRVPPVPKCRISNVQYLPFQRGARPGGGFQAGTDQRADNTSSDWLGMPVAACGCLAPLKGGEMVQR